MHFGYVGTRIRAAPVLILCSHVCRRNDEPKGKRYGNRAAGEGTPAELRRAICRPQFLWGQAGHRLRPKGRARVRRGAQTRRDCPPRSSLSPRRMRRTSADADSCYPSTSRRGSSPSIFPGTGRMRTVSPERRALHATIERITFGDQRSALQRDNSYDRRKAGPGQLRIQGCLFMGVSLLTLPC